MLHYTTNNWRTSTPIQMTPSTNQTYIGTILGQPAGTRVAYEVEASDTAGNTAKTRGSYEVKDQTTMTLSLSSSAIYINEMIVVTGRTSAGNITVKLNYSSNGQNVLRYIAADENGLFTDEYAPGEVGNWTVSARWQGDATRFAVFSGLKNFTIQKVPTSVELALSSNAIEYGSKISINGTISPALENRAVELVYSMPNGTVIRRYAYTSLNGEFTADFTPHLLGTWEVQAHLTGDAVYFSSSSGSQELVVNNTLINMIVSFLTEYTIYIVAAAGAAASAVFYLFYWRRRE